MCTGGTIWILTHGQVTKQGAFSLVASPTGPTVQVPGFGKKKKKADGYRKRLLQDTEQPKASRARRARPGNEIEVSDCWR